ncbi:MAG: hypothetical protein HYS06_06785 [Methylocystis sp.]|nr:hypothetical protein [Methylocystis sp.]
MSFRFKSRSLILATLIALALASLSGCGRRGPVELPPEVAARAPPAPIEETSENPCRPPVKRIGPGAARGDKSKAPIPGTIGHRPPDQYPFPLDPLL